MTTMTTIEVGGIAVDFILELLPNGQTRYEVLDTDFGDTQEDEWPSHHWRTHANELAAMTIRELQRRLERGFVVQMYEVGQAYGGPEEGGWWYDYGQPLDHWFRTTLAEAITLKEELAEECERSDRHVAIRFDQDTTGWPETRPHYS
jgi:hypothetical protein